MADATNEWEQRVAACWAKAGEMTASELIESIDALAAERPDSSASLFEKAAARDTAGREADAEPLYRAALSAGGLDALRHARAAIQLGSTLRLLGRFDESEQLLRAEIDRANSVESYPLRDEAHAFLALTLLARGRAAEAAAIALVTLAPHLSRYSRAVRANAVELAASTAQPAAALPSREVNE
jgi:tetratricopeptide (TPR) repeat protein